MSTTTNALHNPGSQAARTATESEAGSTARLLGMRVRPGMPIELVRWYLDRDGVTKCELFTGQLMRMNDEAFTVVRDDELLVLSKSAWAVCLA